MDLWICVLESVLFDFFQPYLVESSNWIYCQKKERWKCSPVLPKWKTGGLLTNWSMPAWPLLFLCQSQTRGSPTIASLWRTGKRKSALHLAPCEFTAVVSRYPKDKHTAAQITNTTQSEDGQCWQYFQDHYTIMRVRFFCCKQMK